MDTAQQTDFPDGPHNICGVLLCARPAHLAEVRAQALSLPGVEIHASTDDGRIVAVVEDVPGRRASQTLAALHDIDGILSVALVYHHFGTDQQGE